MKLFCIFLRKKGAFMKIKLKLLITVALLIISIVCFGGCSSDDGAEGETTTMSFATEATQEYLQSAEVTETTGEAETTPQATSVSESNAGTDTVTDESRTTTQKTTADELNNGNMVIGKVRKISGNKVTIAIADFSGDFEVPSGDFEGMTMPSGMTPPNGAEFSGDFSSIFSGGFNFSGLPDIEGFDFSDFANGEFPSGEFPSNGQFPSFNMEDVELTYTGETREYVIPENIKINSGDYTSLSEGMVIGLQTDDSGAVSSVLIISK